VLTKAFGLIARHRSAFLVLNLTVAVTLGAIIRTQHDGRWIPLFSASVALTFGLLLLAPLALFRYHPATLALLPGRQAFATAPNPYLVLTAAAYTFIAAGMVIDSVVDILTDGRDWVFDLVPIVTWLPLTAFFWYLALSRFGLRLRPDGIQDRQPFGSLFVPWEALAAAEPHGRAQLTLHCRQPHLVRRRGLRPLTGKTLSGSDAGYLARVIHEYVTHADHRPAIGTPAELTRLTGAVG
jgi:hypothetical protein